MSNNVIDVNLAAEHYTDAFRRGRGAGKLEEYNRILKLLEELHRNAPFSTEMKLGLHLALTHIKGAK